MQIFTRKKSFYVKNANMLANVIFFLYLCTANCAYNVKDPIYAITSTDYHSYRFRSDAHVRNEGDE